MTTVFDQLKPMSFGGLEFPYQNLRVRGGFRDHVHYYPHVAGGAAEKLGRKLYDISVTANFQAALVLDKYRTLWPNTIAALREWWQNGSTQDLHIPIIGTIKAYCVEWEESSTARNRSGTVVDMTFREDQTSQFLVAQALQTRVKNYGDALATLYQIPKDGLSDGSVGLFDGINEAGDALLGIKDQFDLYGQLVVAKIESLVRLCSEADQQVRELADPAWNELRDALHDLWLSVVQLDRDAKQQAAKLRTYVTPVQMTINAAAGAVGITNPADMMQMNAIVDPLAIPAGTSLRYYVPAAA